VNSIKKRKLTWTFQFSSFLYNSLMIDASSFLPIYQLQLLTVMLLVIVIAYWVQSVVSYFYSCMSLRSRLIWNSPHYLGYGWHMVLIRIGWMPFPFKLSILQYFATLVLFQIFPLLFLFRAECSCSLGNHNCGPHFRPFSLLVLLFFVFFFPFFHLSSGVFRRFGPKAVTYTPFLSQLPHTQLILT